MFTMYISQCGKGSCFVFLKKGFRELSIVFGDFLILRFCPMCVSSPLPFEWFALWVVWAACPGILWKVGVLCFIIPLIYASFMFSLISKWETDLVAVCLETHHLLNSVIFISFLLRGILWNERIVNWYKLSPSNVSLVGREKQQSLS